MRTIDRIIVHCAATPEGKDFHAADIDRWHRQRKFKCIGYHYVIDLDGTVERGRPDEMIGAHCTGYNQHSIGVCYIGGMDKQNKNPKDTRTQAQKDALWDLLFLLKQKYPAATIAGHRDFANKACPSFDATKEYKSISDGTAIPRKPLMIIYP